MSSEVKPFRIAVGDDARQCRKAADVYDVIRARLQGLLSLSIVEST